MAHRAARIQLRLSQPHRLSNVGGACIQQNGVATGMKILARPGDVLAPLFPGSSMATRGFTTCGTDKLCSGVACLVWFFPLGVANAARDRKANQETA